MWKRGESVTLQIIANWSSSEGLLAVYTVVLVSGLGIQVQVRVRKGLDQPSAELGSSGQTLSEVRPCQTSFGGFEQQGSYGTALRIMEKRGSCVTFTARGYLRELQSKLKSAER